VADMKAGTLWVPARLDFRRFRREIKETLPSEAKAGGRGAASAIAEGLRANLRTALAGARAELAKSAIDEKEFRKRSATAAKAFLDGMNAELRNKAGSLREGLARGLINPEEFRRLNNAAKREFNQGVLAALKDMQQAGLQNTEEYNRLQRALKNVGEAGRRAGTEGQKGMGLLGRAAAQLKANVQGLVSSFAALFAIDRIRQWGTELIRFARQLRDDATRQRAVWEANAGHVGRTFEEIQRFSRQMQRETFFGSNEIDLAIAQLLTYKSIQEDVFERTIKLGGDMASVYGGIEKSVEALARALDDPIRGLGMLRKMGFTFDDAIIEQVKRLTEQNRLYEAQVIILNQLEAEVGGVAAAMKTGWPALLDNVSKKWQTLKARLAETVAVPVVSYVLGIADALIDLDDPLDRSIEQLRRFGEATEAVAVALLSERLVRLRGEVETLRKETEGAQLVVGSETIVRGGAGRHQTIDIGGMSAAQLDRTITETRRALMQAEVDLADAREKGDRVAERTANAERRRLQARIDLLEEYRRKQEQLQAKTEELRETEEALADARERFNLRRRRTAIAERIEELRAADTQLTPLIEHLEKELERLDRALEPKERKRTSATPTEEELQEGEKALKALKTAMSEYTLAGELGLRDLAGASDEVRAALRELLSLQQQMEDTETQLAAIRKAGLQVPPGAEAFLRWLREMRDTAREAARELIDRWQRELPAVVVELQNSFGRIPSILLRMEDGTRSLDEAMDGLGSRVRQVTDAERELLSARLARDPERIARAERRVADARKEVQRYTAQLYRALEQAGLPAEELNQLIERLVELLQQAGVEVEETKGRFEDLASYARSLEGLARGVLSVADAMGILDDRTRRSLQGVIDLADGIGKIASGNAIGGLAQSIGGVIGLLGGLFGGGDADRQAEELRRTLEANTEALERLRRDVNYLAGIVGGTSGGLVAGVRRVIGDVMAGPAQRRQEEIDRLIERYTDGGTRSMTDWEAADIEALRRAASKETVDDIRRALAYAGYSMSEIKALAERFGITLNDTEASWRMFWRALQEADWDTLFESWTGQLDLLRREFKLFDISDPIEQLRRYRDLLFSFADLPDHLADALAGFDLSTAEGQQAFQQFIQDLFRMIQSGEFELAWLGGLTPDEFLDWLSSASDLIGGAGGVVGGGAPETRLSVGITEVQANQLLAIESTQLYHLAAIHALLAGGSAPTPYVPQIAPPSAAELSAALGRTGGASPGPVSISGINVALNFPALTGTADREKLVEAGAAAGAAFGAAAADRIRAAYRGRGGLGSPQYRADVGGLE